MNSPTSHLFILLIFFGLTRIKENYLGLTVLILYIVISGHLKMKCVVSSFQLYHQSNEVSIEIFGIKPTPKSVMQRRTDDLETILEFSASAKSADCLHYYMIYALIILLSGLAEKCNKK